MAEIKLSPRLEAIVRLVPGFGGVADVGTDHGYIPVRLSLRGHVGGLFATDINEGPLEHARQTASEYGLDGKISFHLCDGLRTLDSDGIYTVIIAGMGGETIASILSAAPWTKLDGRLLILQPMSKASFLRSWLYENGYKVLSEHLVEDGILYELLTAQGGADMPYSPAELLTGHRELISGDPFYPERLDFLINREKHAGDGLSLSSKPEDRQRAIETEAILFALLQFRLEGYNKDFGGQNA